jgi:hypothetical protein
MAREIDQQCRTRLGEMLEVMAVTSPAVQSDDGASVTLIERC